MPISETYWLPRVWRSMRLTISIIVCVVLLLCIILENAAGSTSLEEKPELLHLLNVIPFADEDPNAGWDRGSELAPAAHLAEEQINCRTDLLPGYELRVLDVDSEGCGLSVITKGLVNMYRDLVDPKLHVVGVMGLVCSSVTNALVPVVDHPEIDYLAVAGSTSPRHRNQEKYPRLFHTISPSNIYNEAVVKLEEGLGWSRLALVYDSLGVYYSTTAIDFIGNYGENLTTVSPITPGQVKTTLDALEQAESRVIYGSVTDIEAARLVCQTYQRGLSYPGYVFIIVDFSSADILGNVNDTSCSEDELIDGVNGVLFARHKLTSDPDLPLFSGITYKDYINLLPNGSNTTEYANVVYDQVWAFALAINSSLETLNGLLSSYSFGDRHITDMIERNLEKVDFQGAAGRVKFDEGRGSGTLVEIFQVFNGKEYLVASYSPDDGQIRFTESGEDLRDTIPRDHFDSVYVTTPLWLAIVIIIVAAFVISIITAVLIILLIWRNSPRIKASSPYLSLCILAGCYMLSVVTVVRTIQSSFFIKNETFLIFVCYSDSWFGSIGLLLIYGTLLVRMMRVHWVFSSFRKTSRVWQDPFLFLGILALCFIDVAILIMWICIDYVERGKMVKYVRELDSPEPYYLTSFHCTSQHFSLWVTIIVSYPGIIMLLVVFFAFRTRHIKREHFKDTKKVNAFVYSTFIVFPLLLVLWRIFSYTELPVLSHLAVCAAFLSIAILCQVFIFIPKTVLWGKSISYSDLAVTLRRNSSRVRTRNGTLLRRLKLL